MVNLKAAIGITLIVGGTVLGVISNNVYDRGLEAVVEDVSSQMNPHVLALFNSEPGSGTYLEAGTRITELRAQMPDYSPNTDAMFGVTGGLILGIGGLVLALDGASDAMNRRRYDAQTQETSTSN